MNTLIEVPIATGELIDKITILEIKLARISDPVKTANVRAELALLSERRDSSLTPTALVEELTARLKTVNEHLWELEDRIRESDRQQDYGPSFVQLARGIFHSNDERAAIKREINLASGSRLMEEKSYACPALP